MSEDQAEAVVGKLREAESLLLSLENANPSVDALHDAKICVWNAMDKIGGIIYMSTK